MRDTIKRLLTEDIDKKRNKMLQYVYHNGVFMASKIMGGYDNLLLLLGEKIPDDLKIQDIKTILKENFEGIGLGEYAYQKPIVVYKDRQEYREIGFLSAYYIIIDIYPTNWDGNEEPETYTRSYESLKTEQLDKICDIIYKSLDMPEYSN